MSKVVTPLNDRQIKQEKPKDKEFTLSDGNGLYLLIKTTGSKIWRFNYISPITKKRTLVSFGTYPIVTLQQARNKRNEYRTLISQGIDPNIHYKEQEQATKNDFENTFKKVADK